MLFAAGPVSAAATLLGSCNQRASVGTVWRSSKAVVSYDHSAFLSPEAGLTGQPAALLADFLSHRGERRRLPPRDETQAEPADRIQTDAVAQ